MKHHLSKIYDGKKLEKMGFEQDVFFASQIDKLSTSPVIKKFESLGDISYAVIKEKKII